MGNQVFEKKACYTLFAKLLAHPKAQDISDLFQKHAFNAVREMVKSGKTLVPRLKQLARMVLSSFASCKNENCLTIVSTSIWINPALFGG